MSVKNTVWMIIAVGTLVACADTGSQYRNTENLERPPAMTIAIEALPPASPTAAATTEAIKQGLDDQVRFDKVADGSALIINKPFDQAWFIVGVLLNQLTLDITDRNRDEGYYYVKYDPDLDYTKPRSIWRALTSLWNDNGYDEQVYALTLAEYNGATRVSAALAPESDSAEKTARDGGDRLLQTLYKTLRHGMAEQSRTHQRK